MFNNIVQNNWGKRQPPPGTPINWSHPMAPRSKTGIFLPFNGGGVPVDLVQNKQLFPYHSTASYGNGSHQPVGPGQFINSMSFRIWNTSNSPNGQTTMYQANGALNGTQTVACIFKCYNSISDGPRLIGTGDNVGIELEPGHSGSSVFVILYGSVAHINTSIPYTLGHWYFFGISSYNNNNSIDVYVFDYDAGKSYYQTVTAPNMASTNGTFQVGGDEGTGSVASDASLYWGLIDYARWSIPEMATWAADPWCFMATPTDSPLITSFSSQQITDFAPGFLEGSKIAYYAF